MNDLYNCQEPEQKDLSVPGDLYIVRREDGTGGNIYAEGIISGMGGTGGTDLTQEIYSFSGDGTTTEFEIAHTLSAGLPTATLLNVDGLVCIAAIEVSTESATVIFAEPPAINEAYTLILTGRKEENTDDETSDSSN